MSKSMRGGVDVYYKGKHIEYKLMNFLRKHGYFVIRAPGSGSKSKRYLYTDVVAIKLGRVLIFEVKGRKERETIEITNEQYEKLVEAQRLTAGMAYIAVYLFNEQRWYVFKLDHLKQKRDHYIVSTKDYDKALYLEQIV